MLNSQICHQNQSRNEARVNRRNQIRAQIKEAVKAAPRYAVLSEDGEVMETDLLTWAQWLEKNRAQRVLAQEELPGGYWISTVFLGLNHQYDLVGPPLWFETMIFAPSDGKPSSLTGKVHRRGEPIFCDRYSTLAQALAGHESASREGWASGTLKDDNHTNS
jgi:hypothetical protein